MLPKTESEVQMQFVLDGQEVNISVPLHLVAHICEDDVFRNELLNNLENGDTKDCFKWTVDATKTLIEKYRYEMEFHHPFLKNNSLWAKIARQMQKEGYSVNANMCENKFQLLTSSYKIIKEKMKTSRTRRHWEYFKLMDDLYTSSIAIKSKISMTALQTPTPSLQDASVQTFFQNYIFETAVESSVSTTFIDNDSVEGLSRINEESSERELKDIEISQTTYNDYKLQLLELEQERLNEFRRFNDIYSRIAGALEVKNSLYEQYLNGRE